jgi:CBS domain containing-hemolysin-like protein
LTGAIAEPALAGLFAPLLRRIGWTGVTDRRAFAIGAALLVANIASMLIGELVPKNFALAKPFGTAKAVAIPMSWVNRLLRPVILLLNRAANWTVTKLGIEPREELAGVRSLEELELIIRSSGEEGELDDAELSLLTRAISFTEKVAADIMVPRVDVDGLSRFDSVADLRRVSLESGHSRFPIFGEDRDEIMGVVHVKDTFRVQPERRSITPVSHIAKPALIVPDSRHLDDLLVDMQGQSRTMALVVDEYGGLAGIVTIEDLLEEILGEITDEHDVPLTAFEPDPAISEQIEIRGLANRHDVEDGLGLELPDGHFETLGGFLVAQLGRFPEAGEKISYGPFLFEVISMDGRRIDRVAVTRTEDRP